MSHSRAQRNAAAVRWRAGFHRSVVSGNAPGVSPIDATETNLIPGDGTDGTPVDIGMRQARLRTFGKKKRRAEGRAATFARSRGRSCDQFVT
jgi:hypothetical protein